MSIKIDFKKDYKDIYTAKKNNFKVIEVPSFGAISISGKSSPKDSSYQSAIEAIYSLAYTIKFMPKKGELIKNYTDYVVAPLEGRYELTKVKGVFKWRLVLLVPTFINKSVVSKATKMLSEKKSLDRLNDVEFIKLPKYKAIQTLHVGAFDNVSEAYRSLEDYCLESKIIKTKESCEVYLSDPRRTSPEKLKTIVRLIM